MAGVGLRIRDYFKIPFSHTNPRMILAAHILAHQGGVHIPFADLETHFQAKGDVHRVARAMVAARQAGLDLDWRTACGFDLAGRDLLDAIERRDFGLFPLPKIAS